MGNPLFGGYNPFQSGTSRPQTLFGFKYPHTRLIFNRDIHNARAHVKASGDALLKAHEQLMSFGDGAVPEEAAKAFGEAARNFNNAKAGLGYAEGQILPRLRGMTRSFADRLGVNTSNWGSTKVKPDVQKVVENAGKIHGNIFQRLISKPVEFATNRPGVAMTAIGLGIVAGIGALMSGGAKRRTEAELQARAQSAMQNGPVTANAPTYQVTPEEWAATQAQMRENGQPGHSHAAAQQARAAAAPTAPSV